MKNHKENVKVWDVPVRLFHWTLVLGFTAAYLTAKLHIGFLHTLIGYFLCVLLLARPNNFSTSLSLTFKQTDLPAYYRNKYQNT